METDTNQWPNNIASKAETASEKHADLFKPFRPEPACTIQYLQAGIPMN